MTTLQYPTSFRQQFGSLSELNEKHIVYILTLILVGYDLIIMTCTTVSDITDFVFFSVNVMHLLCSGIRKNKARKMAWRRKEVQVYWGKITWGYWSQQPMRGCVWKIAGLVFCSHIWMCQNKTLFRHFWWDILRHPPHIYFSTDSHRSQECTWGYTNCGKPPIHEEFSSLSVTILFILKSNKSY